MIVDIATLFETIDINMVILENINIDKAILENIGINKDNLENIDLFEQISPMVSPADIRSGLGGHKIGIEVVTQT